MMKTPVLCAHYLKLWQLQLSLVTNSHLLFLSKNDEDAKLEEEEDYDDRNEINPDDDVINDFWMVMVKNKTTVDNSFENSFHNSFDNSFDNGFNNSFDICFNNSCQILVRAG